MRIKFKLLNDASMRLGSVSQDLIGPGYLTKPVLPDLWKPTEPLAEQIHASLTDIDPEVAYQVRSHLEKGLEIEAKERLLQYFVSEDPIYRIEALIRDKQKAREADERHFCHWMSRVVVALLGIVVVGLGFWIFVA